MTATAILNSERQKTVVYFLLLALASLIWSGQGIAVKVLDAKLGPIAITFLPFYVTTLFMLPLLIGLRRKQVGSRALSIKDWLQLAIAGIGGQMLAQLGMTWGISKSLASNDAILNLLIPVISAVLASFMLRERLTLLRTASLAIGLVGVVFLSVGDLRHASFGSMRFLTGNLLIFGGCLGSSFYNVYCKELMQKFQELEILIFSYITASLASMPLLIWVEPIHWDNLRHLDGKSVAAFVFLAFFMYGASMLLFFKVLQHLDVTTASTSLYLVPVFGVVLATTLLGERVNFVTALGAVIVLISTILVVRYDKSY